MLFSCTQGAGSKASQKGESRIALFDENYYSWGISCVIDTKTKECELSGGWKRLIQEAGVKEGALLHVALVYV
jgi:hypothetical protein